MFFKEGISLRFALFYEGDDNLIFMGDPSDIEIGLLKLQYNSEDSYYYSTAEELNKLGIKLFESFVGKDGESQYFIYRYNFSISMK